MLPDIIGLLFSGSLDILDSFKRHNLSQKVQLVAEVFLREINGLSNNAARVYFKTPFYPQDRLGDQPVIWDYFICGNPFATPPFIDFATEPDHITQVKKTNQFSLLFTLNLS